jgi:hypothetical protein
MRDAGILVSLASINCRLILQHSRPCYGNRPERRIDERNDANPSAFSLTDTIDEWKGVAGFIVWGCLPSGPGRGVIIINPNFLKDELQEISVTICALRVSLPSESAGYESGFGSRLSWLGIYPKKGKHFCLMTDKVLSMRPPQ